MSGRIALVALGSAARRSGYLIRNEREPAEENVIEREEEEEEKCKEEEEVQVSAPSVNSNCVGTSTDFRERSRGRKVRAASDYIGHVYDDGALFCGSCCTYRLQTICTASHDGYRIVWCLEDSEGEEYQK